MKQLRTAGQLFYVVGPSGAGKDTLIQYAREKIGGQLPVLFAHRYITRPADAGGENHIFLSKAEFLMRKERRLFAMDWHSHGNYYGIGKEILLWMDSGATVIVNGSREYLPVASSLFPDMVVVFISVSEEVLLQRLRERGRESEEEIKKRIERSRRFSVVNEVPNQIQYRNDQDLETSGSGFVELLIQHSSSSLN